MAPATRPPMVTLARETRWRTMRTEIARYSTVTDLARLRGWSTLQPRRTAT